MQDNVPASRKFIDLIRQASSKWASWDPPIEIKVGDYGMIDSETGGLEVDGNIYSNEFQTSLNNQGIKINLSEPSCQPQKSAVEEDSMIISSPGVKQMDLSVRPNVSFLNLASPSVGAEFRFQEDKRGAILVMYKPRQQYLPRGKVLTLVHKAIELHDKYLVTSTFKCQGYFIYLSNKSGERIALALTTSAPTPGTTAGGTASVDWWTDAHAAFTRKAIDNDGQSLYTPLYTLRRRQNSWMPRLFRGEEEEETEDDLWADCSTPWQPLDEDGKEDPVWEEADDEFTP